MADLHGQATTCGDLGKAFAQGRFHLGNAGVFVVAQVHRKNQGGGELVLKPLERLARGGLRQMQARSGAADAAFTRNGEKGWQQVPVEAAVEVGIEPGLALAGAEVRIEAIRPG